MELKAMILVRVKKNGKFTYRWKGNKRGLVTVNIEFSTRQFVEESIKGAIEKYGLEEVRRDNNFIYYKRTK